MMIKVAILGYANLVFNCCLINWKEFEWRIIKISVYVDSYYSINYNKNKNVLNVRNRRFVPSIARNVSRVIV